MADVTAPLVVGRGPVPGVVGVPLGASVTVAFDEVMDPATIDGSTFGLRAEGAGSDVAAVVTPSGSGATLVPDADLAGGTLYTVTVDASVADVAGNPLGADDTWGFTTAVVSLPDGFGFYRPANGRWYVQGEDSVGFSIAGELGDIVPVPADYDGDGAAEFAFYRPSNGRWYVIGENSVGFGFAGESDIVPVPADFDGDGAAEFGFYRPSNGRWYVIGENSVGFSTADIVPVPADYDGDGAVEFGFYRPSNGRWYVIGESSVGYGFAGETDIVPLPGRY